jgi:hypothetical protein
MMWVFGGGRLWLPKRGLQIGDERPNRGRLAPSPALGVS